MAVDYNGTMGQVIKRKRLQLGISLRDLAKAANVSHVTIMRIEDDKFNMVDPAILTAIAEALHLDRLFLLSLNGAGVEDEDSRIIARAAGKMSPEQRQQMLAMLRGSFAEAFKNTASDDLDDTEEEYLDERV